MIILTTRFNQETWEENKQYRIANNIPCIYNTPFPIKQTIDTQTFLFILEMNNTTNQLEGIGLIQNKLLFNKKYHVYKTGNFNRYSYKGKFYLFKEKIERENPFLLKTLENILFKGKTHLKRGAGMTQLTKKITDKHDISLEEIIQQIKILFISLIK
jgi:hypothetical protein